MNRAKLWQPLLLLLRLYPFLPIQTTLLYPSQLLRFLTLQAAFNPSASQVSLFNQCRNHSLTMILSRIVISSTLTNPAASASATASSSLASSSCKYHPKFWSVYITKSSNAQALATSSTSPSSTEVSTATSATPSSSKPSCLTAILILVLIPSLKAVSLVSSSISVISTSSPSAHSVVSSTSSSAPSLTSSATSQSVSPSATFVTSTKSTSTAPATPSENLLVVHSPALAVLILLSYLFFVAVAKYATCVGTTNQTLGQISVSYVSGGALGFLTYSNGGTNKDTREF